MKKTYQLKTNAIKGEQQVMDVSPSTGKSPVKVPAAAGARYELIDTSTQAAPDNVRAMRKDKNLQIFFDGDAEPGAVIENFYQAHTDNLPTLVGRTEQGVLYEYIPESAAPTAVVSQLGDTGNAYGMALGGQELPASGAAVGLLAAPLVAGFSPWLLGAGALGAAALAGGGGSGGGSSSISATGKLADASDTGTKGDNITNNTTPTLTGSVPAGSTATVTLNGKTYPVTVNSDGTYSYTITDANKLPDGTYTPVVHVTKNGTTTDVNGTPFTIDTKTYVTITKSGRAGTSDAISGTAEAGDKVEVTDANGAIIGTTTADNNGQWSLKPATIITAGTIKATATDAAANTATDNANNMINGGKAVGLSISMDTNNDGFINANEKGISATDSIGSKATDLRVTFDSAKVAAGQTLNLTDVNDSTHVIHYQLTQADVDAGQHVFTGWNLPTDGSSVSVKAALTDGIYTTPTAADNAKVDTAATSFNVDAFIGSQSSNVSELRINALPTGLSEEGSFKLFTGNTAIVEGTINANHDVTIKNKTSFTNGSTLILNDISNVTDIHLEFTDLAGNVSTSTAGISSTVTLLKEATFTFIV